MIKRLLLGLIALIVVLATVLVVRTLATPKPARQTPPPLAEAKIDEAAALQRFSGAVKLQTVSTADAPPAAEAMMAFHQHLQASFPLLFAQVPHETVGHAGALLFTWQGSDATLPPIILMAHQDTVPIEDDSRQRWHREPFSGEVADGTVWGRGTLDDKASLVAQMEAVETLLQSGFKPRRTIYLAYGSDEERGGDLGAQAIVDVLKQRGVHAQFVLDEGGAIADGMMPGVPGKVAVIGISEKGYQSVRLSVEVAGGHSSQPPADSAIGLLSRAMTRLDRQPMPARINPVAAATFDAMAPYLPFGQKLVMRNRWLTTPLLIRLLGKSPAGAAMVRTTTALTMFNAGVKDNVLPTRATAVVNFRIAPGDTRQTVLAHVRDAVADPRIKVEALDGFGKDPSPVSPVDGEGYAAISRSIARVAPEVPVLPYLMVAASDAARYTGVSDAQYRFVPFTLGADTAPRIHGIDEGIAVTDYLRCIRFYHALIQDVAG